ncbi:hypothetical protein KR009_011559 [Drosophila setifemur]|nr:hypothetical protein KR009_011559 [Drosophila setifemur]
MDEFVKSLIEEVKSQGVFDEFRFNCCLADVDTKPAYQNVRNRVEKAVSDFLGKQHWTPDTNKLQLRERLRKHLLDSEVLEKGVDQIVDQVVNPKVATIFEPKIESIVYKYLGIAPPPPPPARPTMLPAPPLPPFAGHLNGSSLLKVETSAGLLPTDLEQISPDSDRATVKSEAKDEIKEEDDLPPGVDDRNFDDDTSPSFEPLSEDKPDVRKEELINGSLNNSDSVNGVSQASQLSQVSSDSRLTIASSTESVADPQQPTPLNHSSMELRPNMPANISEEAQMPKFSENSSDASENSRQLHFDIKQDAITFEGTERKNSVSKESNGALGILSIEDAIMSEVKAVIDDVNNASIETTADPEPVQPQPPPPPPAPPKVEPPPTPPPPPPESSVVSSAEPAAQDTKPKDSDNPLPEVQSDVANVETKPEPLPVVANEAKEEKSTLPAKPAEVESLKEEINKSCDSTVSPTSSKSSSKDKDKDRRYHSHSDDKQRRKSRDRDRDRDHSRDKSHSKHSTSYSSKHSSSQSSSSKHRSSSSKNEKSSSSSSSRNHRESSSTKRSASTSSSRPESSSSSHKKHKSSSSSSRSDRDKDRDKDKEKEKDKDSQSRSHHSSSSSSSSSKRKDPDRKRDRERDRHKSNSSSTTATPAIQDDHGEIKAKLHKRKSSDSNDEGKPPGSGGPARNSPAENVPAPAPEKTEASVENGNGTNGNSNSGSNGECDTASRGVVIVSDILQQSSTSFIELTAGAQSQKEGESSRPETENIDGEEADVKIEPLEESALEEAKPYEQPQESLADKAESKAHSTVEESKEVLEAIDDKHKPQTEDSLSLDLPVATELPQSAEISTVEELTQELTADLPAPQIPNPNAQSDELAGDFVTHFEENTEEFKERLLVINKLIEDRQNLVNKLSVDGCQEEAVDVRALRRSISKRRRSSMHEQHKHQLEGIRETTPPRLCSPSSSSTSGSPAKRLRRDEPKSSPTPSEASINSKENEALEKQEHVINPIVYSADALSARRLNQKLCQQQRYSNDDLYKPRPILSQRSRRRGLDSIL